MKRFLFYLLAIAAVAGSSFVVWSELGAVMSAETHFEVVKKLFEDGNFKFDTTLFHIYWYGLAGFFAINAIILFTLVIMFLINLGFLTKIMRFYSVAAWFLLSALAFTGVYAYVLTNEFKAFEMKLFTDEPMCFVPIGAAVLLAIFGLLFRKAEKKAQE